MYADQHLHCHFSGDSDTPPEKQIEKALSLGMTHICFTDHHDHDVISDIDFSLDFAPYFSTINSLREKYSDKLNICCGVELGLQPHLKDYCEELVKKYPFDFVIGSVHFVDGLDPYYDEYFSTHPDNAYERYFETVYDAAKNQSCFDSLGHLDYIVRYGSRHGLDYSYKKYADLLDPILKVIIEKGIALECNTGGLSRGLSEPNPCRDILLRYREMGGELITLGSDAHSPETLGYAFDECGKLLKECGFKYYALYNDRKAQLLPL